MRRSHPSSQSKCSRFVIFFAVLLFILQFGVVFFKKTDDNLKTFSTFPRIRLSASADKSGGSASVSLSSTRRQQRSSARQLTPPPSDEECDDWECGGKKRSILSTKTVKENEVEEEKEESVSGASISVVESTISKETRTSQTTLSSATAPSSVETQPRKRIGYHRSSQTSGTSITSVNTGVARKQTHAPRDFFVENRAVSAADVQRIDSSSMTSYISTGGRFPILIVTNDRAEMLAKTLDSISSVRGVTKEDVFVIQDGRNEAVSQVLTSRSTKSHRRPDGVGLRGNVMDGAITDGAQRIAQHYNYALGYMFDFAFTSAPAVIVVEDDFLFSPDFYEYFHAVAPAIEADPTLWLASGWNDNGFDYLVADPFALRRTSFFPGLGWLLPRKLFKTELQPKWPATHWDHWMRDPLQHNGRDVIYPEINRNYHAGIRGTFMDSGTHNRYFGSIAMQADTSFTWDTPVGASSIEEITLASYERRLLQLLTDKETIHLKTVKDILSFTEGIGVVWYSCPPNEENHNKMRAVAGFFGIWHEGGRGSRDGIHEIWWLGSAKLLLINAYQGAPPGFLIPGSTMSSSLSRAMPVGHIPLEWDMFISINRPQLPRHTELFGAITSSPLSHLDGGDDANGQPDTNSGSNGSKDASVVVYVHDAEDQVDEHEHSKFMGDLSLKTSSRLAGQQEINRGGDRGESKVGALPANVRIVAGTKSGLSCTEVCQDYHSSSFCINTFLRVINDCSSLKANFPCKACGDSIGMDQPAYVSDIDDSESGMCLVNGDAKLFSCDGSHKKTRRLCACMEVV
jgi:hypothetical protein